MFWADFTDDEGTKATIKQVFDNEKVTIDPHTAVAFKAAMEYKKQGGQNEIVVVSTASPYKFGRNVLSEIGEHTDNMDDFAVLGLPVPKGLAALKTAKVLHNDIVEKDKMPNIVMDFAGE